jgi:hypothetical protein
MKKALDDFIESIDAIIFFTILRIKIWKRGYRK